MRMLQHAVRAQGAEHDAGSLRAQVVTPNDGTSDNFARIVVNLRLKQAGTYSVRSTQAPQNRKAFQPACNCRKRLPALSSRC